MKKTRVVINSCSKRNIPVDLWPEILSRLPVKSLLRFRCVSKPWCTLIGDPDFCRLHLKHFKNNQKETPLFVVEEHYKTSEQSCVIRQRSTFETTTRIETDSPSSTRLGIDCHVVCGVDGLVVLQDDAGIEELILWNPSIRRTRILPPSPEISERKWADCELGFDPLADEYKLVRFIKNDMTSLHSIDVYNVGSNSWKTIQFQGKGYYDWRWSCHNCHAPVSVCFRGVIYFTRQNLNTDAYDLLSFDLKSEVFSPIRKPPYLALKGLIFPVLVDDASSLAMVAFTIRNCITGSIWMMESSGLDTGSTDWTKLHTFSLGLYCCNMFEPSDFRFLYLTENGNIVVQWMSTNVYSYNPETRERRPLLKFSTAAEICGARTMAKVSES